PEEKPEEPAPAEPAPEVKPEEPAPAQPAPEEKPAGSANTYEVVKGDCLWNIAQKFYGTGAEWTTIYEANKDTIKNPDQIWVGQILVIPAK
ncbi:MAG: LysM peptidoglycan-binding domain-containing protein, partial [Oscillospiraceae bacterium]|nr:LysM peptidoglycan-binding domain-containing protein [Oscillospiraceae bacterium]